MDGEASNPRDAELVANLGWVQRLALSLVRERHAADDLAQDVARVWLEKRPALADGPRGWLAAVARKLALDRARAEVSRRGRERSAARPEGGSFEVVERGARQRRVVEAVLQLAEPYRSTILYRYLDDLSTREVAERMGVPEPTVRKRVERGLALLRERLDREFGSRSNAWAVLLLEPGLRGALLKGVGVMSVKWIAAAGAVVLLAGLAWYLNSDTGPGTNEAVGGTGVVVPLEIAAARERSALVEKPKLEDPDEVQRTPAATVPAPAAKAPNLRGFIFVDDEHRVPADIAIAVEQSQAKASCDPSRASWTLDELDGKPARLWITSGSTVPALIPVPAELCEKGGVFDLHLVSGRTLVLTFLDRETKAPLPNLEFQLSSFIELERSRGRVSTRSNESQHRTDAQGKATLTGAPLSGFVSVTVDFTRRTRDIVMKDGASSHMSLQREPDWGSWFKQQQPARVEQTILVSLPLGEACAAGRIPAWAIALAGNSEAVRVLARETTNETPQARGMPFLLPADAQGRFELCANAPATLVAWLERAESRERLSAETQLVFAHPGAQDPVGFRELQGKKVTLRFIHVPEHGELQAWVHGKDAGRDSVSMRCEGADFTREFTLVGDERIQLTLRTAASAHEKSGWTRQVEVDLEPEITIDLGGSERTLRLDCPELGELSSEGSVLFLRCDRGEASLDQTILVLCNAGRGATPVLVPNGRWLYRYDDPNQVGVWGLVDVTSATRPGEELVLRPRLRLASPAEIQPGIRFDEIEGISLAKLPEKLRTASAKGGAERVALPLHAKYATLEGK
jgi:RNA polymerase sigma-70 factor (ECF subfamily)